MGPGDLSTAVKGLFDTVAPDPNVIVGFGTLDDAGVYRINTNQALVQTVDFITPVVDDPFAYGEIAAANSLSDVYAMGGTPITALNVTCFGSDLDKGILREILRGGLAKTQEAGVALLGGHTVDDPEIKYGLSVTGLVDPAQVLANSGAKIGDVLVLTKPLGIGVLTTALKRGVIAENAIEPAVQSMRTLNRMAREAMVAVGVHACTDVTGFGLTGHLHHMAHASGVTARLDARALPLLPEALELSRRGVAPGGTGRNRAHFGPFVALDAGIEEGLANLLFDPQTSGGLLIAVAAERAAALIAQLTAYGVTGSIIGEMIAPAERAIMVI